jgi:hypothetical protein
MTTELTGRELDAEIGRKLFGLKIFRPSEVKGANGECFDMDDYYYIPSKKPPRTHMIDARPVPAFSSDVNAALLVVKVIGHHFTIETTARGFNCKISTDRGGEKDSTSHFEQLASQYAEEMAEAICRAAVRMLEERK